MVVLDKMSVNFFFYHANQIRILNRVLNEILFSGQRESWTKLIGHFDGIILLCLIVTRSLSIMIYLFIFEN